MNNITLIRYATVVIVIAILTGTWLISERQKAKLMSSDIQLAIQKGVDPLVVRCAYAQHNDSICLVYSTLGKQAVEIIKESGATKK